MKKRAFKIVVNDQNVNTKPLEYTYSNTKGILLRLAKGKALVTFSRASNVNQETIFARNDIFVDALNKIFVLHLMKYGNPLKFKSITVYANDEALYSCDSSDAMPIETYCDDWHGSVMFCKEFEKVSTYYLSKPKSNQGRLHAALHAYLIACGKSDNAVRFAYLWMAVNAMYGYLADSVYGFAKQEKLNRPKRTEIVCIELFHAYLNPRINKSEYRTNWSKNSRKDINKKLTACISRICDSITENDKQAIQTVLCENNVPKYMSAKSYLALELGYELRCNLFHGEKPIRLCGLKGDYESKRYKVVNSLLLEIIEEHLYKWLLLAGEGDALSSEVQGLASCFL